MTKDHPHRPRVAPVLEPADRPTWSVMIPTYNCAGYLRETLESVLAQDPGPDHMQIEVVDDHSTLDDPEAVVQELAPGRVSFYRQPHNIGHTRNFNTCLHRSRGHLIHLLHGDDAVLAGFYATMQHIFDDHSNIGAAYCRYIAVNERGQWLTIARLEVPTSGPIPDWFERIATGQRLQPPTMVVRREVYEDVGGFDQRIPYYGEDWEMWTRIASRYPVWYETKPLALYRVHSSSLSGRTLVTGQNMRDLRLVADINRELLPTDRANEFTSRALENNALGALRRAQRVFDAGNRRAAVVQVREALVTSQSRRVLGKAGRLLAQWSWRGMRRGVRTGVRRLPIDTGN